MFTNLVEKGEVEVSDDQMFAYGVMHTLAGIRTVIHDMQETQKSAMKN